MSSPQPTLFNRPDTLLGVCEGLGQDFGVNPLWLRIGFALTIFWSPLAALSVYLGLGVALLAARLMFPKRIGTAVSGTAPRCPTAGNDDEMVEQARAA